MKNKLKYFLLITVSLVIFSCFKDQGNYQYDIKDKVKIANMNQSYTVVLTQKLTIDPKVENPQKYDYLWLTYLVSNAYAKIDTLSKDAVFSENISMVPGEYHLELQLKDKENGSIQYERTKLFMTTNFAIGWYLLKSNGTTSDVDIFSSNGVVYQNTIKEFNGASMDGKPLSLVYYSLYKYRTQSNDRTEGCAFGVATDKDVSTFNTFNQERIHDKNTLFFDNPEGDIKPVGLYHSWNNNVLMSNKGFQLIQTNVPTANRYGLPISLEDVNIEPLGLVRAGDNYLVYDKKERRLLKCSPSGTFGRFSKTGSPLVTAPDLNNLDVYPLYMSSMGNTKLNSAKTRGHMIMQKFESSDRFIYVMNHELASSSSANNPILDIILLNSSSKIGNATIFGHNYEFSYIYYPSDGGIYMYDVSTKTESSIIDGIAGEVTLVKHIWYSPGETPGVVSDAFNHLVVATHNNGKYKVYLYDMVGGKPSVDPVKVFEGDGKVECIQYISSKMSQSSMFQYSFH